MDQLLSSQPMEDPASHAHRSPAGSETVRPPNTSRSRVPEPAPGSSLVLSREELEALTGLRQPKRMCEWLEQRTWVFEAPCRRGELPKVDRAYYLARMSGQQAKAARNVGPQLDFMMGRR